jgi:hypothetical protein
MSDGLYRQKFFAVWGVNVTPSPVRICRNKILST